MIRNKRDLYHYLEQDKIALGIANTKRRPRPFYDETWRFQIALRKAEYALNCKNKNIIYLLWNKLRFHLLSVKYGFSIPLNVFKEGLSIAHYGTIVVNSNARIGKNCRIQENVNIGSTGNDKAPKIGNNVFIGTGAKIIGNIEIADNISIGAGAVVVDSFLEKGITIGGVPAKKISNNDSSCFIQIRDLK